MSKKQLKELLLELWGGHLDDELDLKTYHKRKRGSGLARGKRKRKSKSRKVGGKSYKGSKRGGKAKKGVANKYIQHVKKYWKAHPKLSWIQAMQKARASYKPKKK